MGKRNVSLHNNSESRGEDPIGIKKNAFCFPNLIMNDSLHLSCANWPKLIFRTKMDICVLNWLNAFHSSRRDLICTFH